MNSNVGNSSGPRPMSVEAIAKRAGDFEYNARIPLRQWLRAADTLQKEAHFYERDGNDQQTYLLLLRHALLILEHLSHHSEAENHDLRQRLTRANEVVKYNLAKLEILKPKINKRYHEYEKLRLRLSAEPNSSGGAKRTSERSENQRSHGWYNDPALDGTKKPLQAYQDADMAVKIHRSEAHRKIAVKRLNAHHDVTTGKKELQHLPDGAWERQEGRLANKAEDSLGDLSTLMQKVHLPKDSQAKTEKSAQFKERPVEGYPSLGPVAYPKVPSKIGLSRPPTQFKGISKQVETLHPTRIPHIPPKLSASPSPPPVPKKISDVGSSVEGTSPTTSASTPKRSSLNTRDYTFVPSAYLENGAPLRTMFLPPDLRHKFLDVAKSNTEQNLETCGFLCGTLVSNALFISRLVIPEQKSTSDTCEMTNESAFFDYCDAEELVVLGWIHTHPTQTCFMSSRDLHTHAAYQAMMAESIAIVCAPSHEPSWGVFRLTDPPGMKTVLNCHQSGVFHPHSEQNVYTDALKPGHVLQLPGLEYDIADLRGA